MSPAAEKFLGVLIFVAVFAVGGLAIWYLSRPDQPPPREEIIEPEDPAETEIQERRDFPQGDPKPKERPRETKKAPAMPEPQMIQTGELKAQKPRPGDHRYPPGLAENQMYFEVTNEGYAIAQGDILLGKVPEEKKGLKNGISQPKKTLLWPSNVIPYTITGDIQNTQPILDAIDYFNDNTSVRFVPAEEGDPDFLVFVGTEDHCASHLGRTGGPQPILLSPKCGKTEVMHELMHALGFVHEHSRKDRDRYIDILWDNIQEPFLFQFNKMPDQLVHSYSGSVFEFDPESIMLYPENAFAKSQGQKTMVSKGRIQINPSKNALSRVDKERLYYLYGN